MSFYVSESDLDVIIKQLLFKNMDAGMFKNQHFCALNQSNLRTFKVWLS